jgi:hypothetical protein
MVQSGVVAVALVAIIVGGIAGSGVQAAPKQDIE